MSLFVVFIFAAVLLGAGAMLSPAWRTAQPRIALCATLCLALVSGGAVFYTEAFGWDTLVIDYLLFALLSGVVLGGTLSTAQARAEARGERLADRDQGWPGPEDLAFFAVVALIIIVPLFHAIAPLGTQGQISALHSLTTREAQSFRSLQPFAPEATAVISPGFHALSAYLSHQLGHSIPLIQMSVSAVVLYLLVWLAYDFGAELRSKRLGRALAIAQLLCFGAFSSYLDGHFSELLALLFLQAFLLFALRTVRQFNLADMIAGGLMLGAVSYTSLSLSLILFFAFIPLLALTWLFRQQAVSLSSRLSLTVGFPLVALLGIAPWLVNNLDLMLPITPSPFTADLSNLAFMTRSQGFVILPLALYGAVLGLRVTGSLRFGSLLMLIWLALVADAALFGILGALIPPLGALTNAANIARHGVILPFTFFGGVALAHIWESNVSAALKLRLRRSAYRLIALSAAFVLLVGSAYQPLLKAISPLFDLPPATLSHAELDAMMWIRENTPTDALLLAADGNAWLPVFAERRTIDFSAVQYFEWDLLLPADPSTTNVDLFFVTGGEDEPTELTMHLIFDTRDVRIFRVQTD